MQKQILKISKVWKIVSFANFHFWLSDFIWMMIVICCNYVASMRWNERKENKIDLVRYERRRQRQQRRRKREGGAHKTISGLCDTRLHRPI